MTNPITRDTLAHAAAHGRGIAHLTPGQAWAAHTLAMPPERLEKPLASHIAALLENVERLARRRFVEDVASDDAEAMILHAHDEDYPMFLRIPALETLNETWSRVSRPCSRQVSMRTASRFTKWPI